MLSRMVVAIALIYRWARVVARVPVDIAGVRDEEWQRKWVTAVIGTPDSSHAAAAEVSRSSARASSYASRTPRRSIGSSLPADHY
jgi:hypothetical protein